MTTQVLIGKVIGVLKSVNFRQLMSLINRFKFSITIVPEGTSYISAKTYSFWKTALFFYLFGTVCAIITGLLMVYTPLNSLFFNQSYQLSHYQVEALRKMDKDLKYLMNEVERLRENNQKLQNAILTGDSTVLNTFIKKEQPRSQQKTKMGGNLFGILEELCKSTGSMEQSSEKLPQAKAVVREAQLKSEVRKNPVIVQAGRFIEFHRPCDGIVSGHFKPEDGHFGIDYSVNVGTPVFSSLNGYVAFADYTADDGNMIVVIHSDGYVTVYKHCLQVLRKARQRVVQGEIIALSGSTGRLSNGPHLHFELWKDGICLDPELYINEK